MRFFKKRIMILYVCALCIIVFAYGAFIMLSMLHVDPSYQAQHFRGLKIDWIAWTVLILYTAIIIERHKYY